MTDQSFHEIQLSGKQLVFVFMSAVVVAVGIFLLGVSVGRGVKSSLPGATTTSVEAGTPSEPTPAPPAASDPTYHDILQGKDTKGTPAGGSGTPVSSTPAPPPTATPTPPPAVPPPAPAPEKSTAKAAEPKGADAKGGKAGDTKAADSKAGASSTGSWFVQIGVYGTKDAADRQVQQLKAKAFTAFVVSTNSPATRFHVRLGPFTQRSDADRMHARLAKEGFDSLVTR